MTIEEENPDEADGQESMQGPAVIKPSAKNRRLAF